MNGDPQSIGGELRLAPESVEAIASRTAELLRGEAEQQPSKRLISAAKVAETWGVDRSWVYAHARQLGARRLGAGKRPRLRFDPDEVAERIMALAGAAGLDRSGSSAMPDDSCSDSISRLSRAIVGRQIHNGRAAL
jgi:hypothetical protein